MFYALALFALISACCLLVGWSRAKGWVGASMGTLFCALAGLAAGAVSLWLLLSEPSLSGRQMPGIVAACYSGALALLVFFLCLVSVGACRQAVVRLREGDRLAPVTLSLLCLLAQVGIWLLFLYVSLRYAGCYDGKGC